MSRDNLLNSLYAVKLFLDRNLVTKHDNHGINAFEFHVVSGFMVAIMPNIHPEGYRFDRYSFAEYLYESVNRLYNYIESDPRIHTIVLDITIPSLTSYTGDELNNTMELLRGIINMVHYDHIGLTFDDMDIKSTLVMNYILLILGDLDYTLPWLHVTITGESHSIIPTKYNIIDKSINVDTLRLELNGIDITTLLERFANKIERIPLELVGADIPMSLSEWIVSKINFRRLVGDTVKDVYYDQDKYEKL